MQNSSADAESEIARALVVSLERGLVVVQAAHDQRRQVMLSVRTTRVGAWHEKERWSVVDHEPTNVSGRRHPRAILDLQLKSHQIRDLLAQSRRFVFASPSVLET